MSLANVVLIVVILAMLGFYVWMRFSIQKDNAQAADYQSQIAKEKATALSSPDRKELLTRQAQLKSLQDIILKHPYWSLILPKLADVTLKKANYMSVKIESTGVLGLSVEVPDTEQLDKFLQIFDLPEYNKYFYNVRIGSISNGQVGDKLLTSFDLKMNYNPELLKYSPGDALKNP